MAPWRTLPVLRLATGGGEAIRTDKPSTRALRVAECLPERMIPRSGGLISRLILVLLAGIILTACAASAGKPAQPSPYPAKAGETRLYVLRPAQELYSVEPATIILDGKTLGVLANGTFLVSDVPSGSKTLTVKALASFVTAQLDLAPGATDYVVITMNPSGLVPPRGAIPVPRLFTDKLGLFSIGVVNEQNGELLLKGLSPVAPAKTP
jgi:hypothetical protein